MIVHVDRARHVLGRDLVSFYPNAFVLAPARYAPKGIAFTSAIGDPSADPNTLSTCHSIHAQQVCVSKGSMSCPHETGTLIDQGQARHRGRDMPRNCIRPITHATPIKSGTQGGGVSCGYERQMTPNVIPADVDTCHPGVFPPNRRRLGTKPSMGSGDNDGDHGGYQTSSPCITEPIQHRRRS